MRQGAVDQLASYVDALRPIIYINHFDFHAVDGLIAQVAGEGIRCVAFDHALGMVDFRDGHPLDPPGEACDLEAFLLRTLEEGFRRPTFLILRDVHGDLAEPKVIALLRRIAEWNLNDDTYHATVFVVSAILSIPRELEHLITLFDFLLPSIPEIRSIIRTFADGQGIRVGDEVVDEIALSFKGLNAFQIGQILNLAYQNGGDLDRRDTRLILQEKRQFVKKSGSLELVDAECKVENIGGLDILKDWLGRKARIFKNLDQAIKSGVDVPKGIMIVGMPGCGKSLTAKATAGLFQIPLVRLDVGRLLGKYVGESEENMRLALRLAEAIAPCVLWVDEIEKAFAGVAASGGEGSEVTTCLFGQFLTWLQEKENTVFIVATANDISNIKPEFLRKGRFDELFFVDLPNGEERRSILEIHLKKRKRWNRAIDTIALIKATEGFSGADLEAVVKEAIERAFAENRETLTTEDLLAVAKETKSISNTLKERIPRMREAILKNDIKRASTPDSQTNS